MATTMMRNVSPSAPTCAAAGAEVAPPGRMPPTRWATRLAHRAPSAAMPAVWPSVRVTDNRPEATPSRLGGTAPMTALLLGDWKTPMPMPMGRKRST